MDGTLQLVFSHEESSINPDDLADFLKQFNKYYKLAANFLGDIPPERVLADADKYKREFGEQLRELLERGVENTASFKCTKIEFNSPLSFFAKGMLSALVLAVIISGGTISIFGANVELTGLVDSYTKLQKNEFDNTYSPATTKPLSVKPPLKLNRQNPKKK